jgi:hypothetical protein
VPHFEVGEDEASLSPADKTLKIHLKVVNKEMKGRRQSFSYSLGL